MPIQSHDHNIDGNSREFNLEQFEGTLRSLRNSRNYREAVYEIFERYHEEELSKAIMIHLVMTTPLRPADKDLVLATWGLLPSFTDIKSLGGRRREYVRRSGYNKSNEKLPLIERDNLTDEEADDRVGNLMKKENPAYKKIAENHYDIALDSRKTNQFILSAKQDQLDVHGHVKMPTPSFQSDYSTIDNLKLRNIHFVAREEILSTLFTNYFNKENPVLVQTLCGMAGIGKSTIALEYAYRNRAIYGLVWWIDASSETTLIKSCTELLEQEGIGYTSNSPSTIVNQFIGFIKEKSNHLIVFDNADLLFDDSTILASLRKYIQLSKSHILITTRIDRDCEWSIVHRIEPFDLETSIAYLVDRSGKPEDEYTRTLAERLNNLPLALTYAGAYIKKHTTFKGYLELWDQTGLKVWDQKDGHYADRTVRQAFDVTLNRIKEDLPDENAILLLELLYVCASFEAEYFPVDAFLEYERSVPDDDVNLLDLVKSFGPISSTAINLEDGKRYWIKYYVKDDHAIEARWDNGPQNGEIVPGNCIRETRDHLIPTLENIIERNELIAKLEDYSLIEVFNGNLKMHPLLREIIRDEEYYTDVPRIKPVSPNYGFTSKVYEFAGDLETASKLKYKHLEFWLSIEGSLIGLPSSENDGYLLTSSLSYRNELFQALLKYGSSELIRYYINLRRARIEGALDNDDTYPYAIQLLLTEDNFYNELSIRLGRRIIYRVYNNPEKVRNTGKEYSIFMTRKSNLGISVAPSDDPAYAAITVVFDDMSMVPNRLSEILSDKTWKWQSIALPAEFNDETQFNAVINRVSKDRGIKFL